jgi:hypothetical protein
MQTMPPLGDLHRNHSFPPCLRFIQKKSTKFLAPPLPSVDDEPWIHFLEPVYDDEDEDEYADFLDFSAGILTNSGASKKEKKPSKFRPANAKKWHQKAVHHHHGTFQRHNEKHGFVENRLDPWSHVVEHDINTSAVSPERDAQLRPRGRSKTRTRSGHRHSWREPSVDIFTVKEEADVVKEDATTGSAEHETSAADHRMKGSMQGISDRARL